jgi:ubiquinone/menaquinone biosynthesis C-methylase UbiE
MATHEPWQLVGTAAELYERYLVPAITALWAKDLVDRACPRAGERILDVACGTGIVARSVSKHVAAGRIVGVDINPGMLAVARSISTDQELPITWVETSALDLPFPDCSFDLVLCQLGLQFFPDQSAALCEMFRILVPGGRVALSVYSAIENTPVAHALAGALDLHLGSGASKIKRSEHSFADPGELHRLLADAGFCEVTIQTVVRTIRFTSPREYVRLQIAATPMAGMVAGMEITKREAVIDAITDALATSLGRNPGTEELTSPQESFVALAWR